MAREAIFAKLKCSLPGSLARALAKNRLRSRSGRFSEYLKEGYLGNQKWLGLILWLLVSGSVVGVWLRWFWGSSCGSLVELGGEGGGGGVEGGEGGLRGQETFGGSRKKGL